MRGWSSLTHSKCRTYQALCLKTLSLSVRKRFPNCFRLSSSASISLIFLVNCQIYAELCSESTRNILWIGLFWCVSRRTCIWLLNELSNCRNVCPKVQNGSQCREYRCTFSLFLTKHFGVHFSESDLFSIQTESERMRNVRLMWNRTVNCLFYVLWIQMNNSSDSSSSNVFFYKRTELRILA